MIHESDEVGLGWVGRYWVWCLERVGRYTDPNGLDLWSYILKYSIISIVIFKNDQGPLIITVNKYLQ